MRRQPQCRWRDKGGEEGIRSGGPTGGGNERGNVRENSPSDRAWLWRERVRAEENQRDRSPRCAGQAIWGRFLATDARSVTYTLSVTNHVQVAKSNVMGSRQSE